MAELVGGLLGRISEQVQRLSGRIHNQSVEFTPSLGIERQYANLGRVFTQFDRLIPRKGLEVWSEGLTGKKIAKQKEFNAKDAVRSVRQEFQSHFPDPTQQSQVIEAVGNFLHTISSYIEPGDIDTVVFGQLDRFLVGFPVNMFSRLGGYDTLETMLQVFQIGSMVLEYENENSRDNLLSFPPSAQRTHMMNYHFGQVAFLVGEAIPEVLARAGVKNKAVLVHLATAQSARELRNLVKYYQEVEEPSSQTQAKIAKLELTIREIDPTMGSLSSPFNQSDRQPWRDERVMGNEQVIPTWGDLGAIVRSGEQDGKEYGIAVRRDSGESGDPHVEYLRGGKSSIHNGAKRSRFGQNIFFHSHPIISEKRELYAPLVSVGDLEATSLQDYGGGYLNVVCLSGVSLHIGAVVKKTRSDSYTYTIESGEFKGSNFLPGRGLEEQVMGNVKRVGIPYVYSITDRFGLKQYFFHIPWEYIDKSVSFYDLCFGGGLARILSAFEDLPELPKLQNLNEALRVRSESVQRSLQDSGF